MSLPYITIPDHLEARFLPPDGWITEALAIGQDRYLRVGHALPSKPAIGTALLLQGMGQAIEDYFETIQDYLHAGYAVASFDWYGQGASSRHLSQDPQNPLYQRLHIQDINTYTQHLHMVLAMESVKALPAPLHVAAHSMGGLLFLHAACTPDAPLPPITSASLIGPFLGMPVLDSLMGIVAHPYLKYVAQARPTAYPLSALCHDWRACDHAGDALLRYTSDPARGALHNAWRLANPVLRTGGATAQCLQTLYTAMQNLRRPETLSHLRIPTLLLRAGNDRVVQNNVLPVFCGHPMIHCRTIPGSAHEILHESTRIRDMALGYMFDWMRDRYQKQTRQTDAIEECPMPTCPI